MRGLPVRRALRRVEVVRRRVDVVVRRVVVVVGRMDEVVGRALEVVAVADPGFGGTCESYWPT